MSKLYRIIIQASWLLGLLSLLAAIILKLLPHLADKFDTNPRGAIEFSVALFLCALATRALQRASD